MPRRCQNRCVRAHLILLALAGLSAAARPAAAGCRVRGEHAVLNDVVVRADRSTTFEVGLADVAAQAVIGSADRVRIEVSGAIAFRGSRKNVWFEVARPIAVAGGVVRLDEGAELVHARADADGVVASVVLWADDVLPGEDKDPIQVIAGVRIPCGAVRLGTKHGKSDDGGDDESDAASTGDAPAPAGDRTFERDLSPRLGWWRNRGSGQSIVVRAAPRADAAGVTLASAATGDGQFDFEGIEQSGDWLRVRRAEWGAEIRGWIPRAELVAMNGPMGRGTMCMGRHGSSSGGGGWAGPPPKVRYEGPARIRVGASIEYGDNVIWAKVRRSDGFEVLIYEGDRYAEITSIPGVWVDSWYAAVNVADVILPRGTP